MLDPIQYEFRFLITTLADLEPEPKLRYSGSSQKFRLHNTAVFSVNPNLVFLSEVQLM
jgi:hypothetical protein